MDVERISLLFCCDSKWLYRDNRLTSFFELRNGSSPHVTEERHIAAHKLLNCDFSMQLAYWIDVFWIFSFSYYKVITTKFFNSVTN